MNRRPGAAAITVTSLAQACNVKAPTVNGWTRDGKLPAAAFDCFCDALKLTEWYNDRFRPGGPPVARLTQGEFEQVVRVRPTHSHRNRYRFTGPLPNCVRLLANRPSRRATLPELDAIVRGMGADQFLVGFAGHDLPLVHVEPGGLCDAAATAVANGARVLVVCPSREQHLEWETAGYGQLSDPTAFVAAHHRFVETCVAKIRAKHPWGLERATTACNDRTALVQARHVPALTIGLTFSCLGWKAATGQELATGLRHGSPAKPIWELIDPAGSLHDRVVEVVESTVVALGTELGAIRTHVHRLNVGGGSKAAIADLTTRAGLLASVLEFAHAPPWNRLLDPATGDYRP